MWVWKWPMITVPHIVSKLKDLPYTIWRIYCTDSHLQLIYSRSNWPHIDLLFSCYINLMLIRNSTCGNSEPIMCIWASTNIPQEFRLGLAYFGLLQKSCRKEANWGSAAQCAFIFRIALNQCFGKHFETGQIKRFDYLSVKWQHWPHTDFSHRLDTTLNIWPNQ